MFVIICSFLHFSGLASELFVFFHFKSLGGEHCSDGIWVLLSLIFNYTFFLYTSLTKDLFQTDLWLFVRLRF